MTSSEFTAFLYGVMLIPVVVILAFAVRIFIAELQDWIERK